MTPFILARISLGAALLFCTSALAASLPRSGSKASSPDAVAYQINAAHTGEISFSGGFTAPLQQAWTQNLGGSISYPLIANGMVFVTAEDSGYGSGTQMYALDLATGTIVWEKLIPGESDWSNAAYDHGEVFLVNGDGDVEASDAKTGKLKWTAQLSNDDGSFSAPVAHNGLLYIGSSGYDNYLYALNETTGATQWSAPLSNYGGASVVAVGGGAVYIASGEDILAFSIASGTSLWSYSGCDQDEYDSLTPVYFMKKLYARTACGGVILDASTGSQTGYFSADPAPAFFQKKDGLALIEGTLYYYNIESGNVVWKYSGVDGDGGLVTAPIVIDGLVIEGAADGNVYVLDSGTGSVESSMNVGAQIPAPNEGDDSNPLTGLAAGEGALVIPAGSQISAYVPQKGR